MHRCFPRDGRALRNDVKMKAVLSIDRWLARKSGFQGSKNDANLLSLGLADLVPTHPHRSRGCNAECILNNANGLISFSIPEDGRGLCVPLLQKGSRHLAQGRLFKYVVCRKRFSWMLLCRSWQVRNTNL